MRVALLTVCAAAAIFLAACAEVGRPPGGPVDKTPPELMAAEPESMRTHVAPDQPLRLTFSEKVDRRKVARSVTFVPPLEIEGVGFDGPTVEFRPKGGWPADTVVVWVLDPGLADKHGVALGTEISGAFTTGASFPPGRIRGVASLRQPPEEATTDWTRLRAELEIPPTEGQRRAQRWRTAAGDEDGAFELEWLELPSGPYQLRAYLDANGNARRDERELVAELDSLFLGPTDSIFVVDPDRLRLVDLEGPVPIHLCVDSVAVDTVAVWVWARGLDEDRVLTAQLDSLGCVDLEIPPGEAHYGAWIDDGDRRFGADSTGVSEVFLRPDTLRVEPSRPDSVTFAWPTLREAWTVLDTLTVPPVPEELWSDTPRGP